MVLCIHQLSHRCGHNHALHGALICIQSVHGGSEGAGGQEERVLHWTEYGLQHLALQADCADDLAAVPPPDDQGVVRAPVLRQKELAALTARRRETECEESEWFVLALVCVPGFCTISIYLPSQLDPHLKLIQTTWSDCTAWEEAVSRVSVRIRFWVCRLYTDTCWPSESSAFSVQATYFLLPDTAILTMLRTLSCAGSRAICRAAGHSEGAYTSTLYQPEKGTSHGPLEALTSDVAWL